MKAKNAQMWSTDSLIGIALFSFIIIFVFYFLGTQQRSERVDAMKQESSSLTNVLGSPQKENLSFIEGTKISKERLASFANLSYEEIKDKLGLDYDFCLYFEDDKGNIINLTYGRPGVGSPNVSVSGAECGLSSAQIVECRSASSNCNLKKGVKKEDCCAYLGVCCS